MVSEKKLIANRENARKSTGPRTPEGKRIASRNAVTHGLLSREALLPGEDRSVLDALRAELTADLAPVGALEVMWVDIIVTTLWKLRRGNRLEAGSFEHQQNENRELERLLGATRQLTVREELARVLTAGGDRFERLARQEGRLHRQLVQAYHELERSQAARRGLSVTPPVALDVTVSTPETTESLSDSEMPTADPLSAASQKASDPLPVQTPLEPSCPAGVEAVDVDVLTDPNMAMGSQAARVQNEPTETG